MQHMQKSCPLDYYWSVLRYMRPMVPQGVHGHEHMYLRKSCIKQRLMAIHGVQTQEGSAAERHHPLPFQSINQNQPSLHSAWIRSIFTSGSFQSGCWATDGWSPTSTHDCVWLCVHPRLANAYCRLCRIAADCSCLAGWCYVYAYLGCQSRLDAAAAWVRAGSASLMWSCAAGCRDWLCRFRLGERTEMSVHKYAHALLHMP